MVKTNTENSRIMGKERDKLIRRLGGVPVSDRSLTDAELQDRYIRHYANKGQLPRKSS